MEFPNEILQLGGTAVIAIASLYVFWKLQISRDRNDKDQRKEDFQRDREVFNEYVLRTAKVIEDLQTSHREKAIAFDKSVRELTDRFTNLVEVELQESKLLRSRTIEAYKENTKALEKIHSQTTNMVSVLDKNTTVMNQVYGALNRNGKI